jgi:renalase
MNKPKIAIIGAGISGLVLANQLKEIAEIEIFEKARGCSGRMSSRYKENFCFDFGAQFFTAKTVEFKEFLLKLSEKNIIKKWCGRFVEIDKNIVTFSRKWQDDPAHYVAVPRMNELCKFLAIDFKIKFQTRISKIIHKKNSASILDEENNLYENFDLVVVTVPAQQALDLIPENLEFYEKIKNYKMVGCYSLMIGFNEALPINWDIAYLKNSKLSWIASENSKPDRQLSFAYTVLSRNAWAENNMDRNIEEVKEELIKEFEYTIGNSLPKIIHSDIHKWRYANISKQKGSKFYYDPKNKIAICGDWLIQGRIESAFQSAFYLSKEIIANIT